MSTEGFALDLFVSEEELMELIRDIRLLWKEGGMSCKVERCEGLFLQSFKDCRMHWREYCRTVKVNFCIYMYTLFGASLLGPWLEILYITPERSLSPSSLGRGIQYQNDLR
uniref:Uncharacterized protein n=1 Tax=Magallana gigas TaxID=29159 RepID=A0A8W8MGV6_MAGGI